MELFQNTSNALLGSGTLIGLIISIIQVSDLNSLSNSLFNGIIVAATLMASGLLLNSAKELSQKNSHIFILAGSILVLGCVMFFSFSMYGVKPEIEKGNISHQTNLYLAITMFLSTLMGSLVIFKNIYFSDQKLTIGYSLAFFIPIVGLSILYFILISRIKIMLTTYRTDG
jgi:cytochrome bd-type quinol oxidase subunit 2|tara:strand:- start:5429 stop:5941 length:513 start_codon:yes stop_codon:yes gene_type:complete